MGLFKKKKEVKEEPELSELPKLPELPRTPELPKFPELSKPETERPSFPNSNTRNLGQEAVESAITAPNEIPPAKEKKTFEMPEKSMPMPQLPRIQSIPTPPPMPKYSKKIEPAYIRIDKFKSAINSFQEIQAKISEIESLLAKIKEQKRKEDEELREWERELETIKARIDTIDKNIFSKLD